MMDERQVERLAACVSAVSGIPDLCAEIRSHVEDVIGAGMEGAAEGDNGGVVMHREHLTKKARGIVEKLQKSDILYWVSHDNRATRMIEEYVREIGGWDGRDLMPLLNRCMEYEIMRIVYAALISVKTVTVE